MNKTHKWDYEQDVICVKRYCWFNIKKEKRSLEQYPELYNCESFKAIEQCENINDIADVIAKDIPEIPKVDIVKKIRKMKNIFIEWHMDYCPEIKPLAGYTKQIKDAVEDYVCYRLRHEVDGTEVETMAQCIKREKQEMEEYLRRLKESDEVIICQEPED